MDFDDHKTVLDLLEKCKEADHDNREMAREAKLFINKRDGQWEPKWYDVFRKKPRYTFDQVSPLVDQVTEQVTRTDYDITVRPVNGPTSKEAALTYDGLVRNSESISSAEQVYDAASRNTVVAGVDYWEVVNQYVDGDSFDQDLLIRAFPDSLNRVWLGPHTKPDASDAQYGWVLTGMTPEEFKKKYPERSDSAGLSGDKRSTAYWYRNKQVYVGQFRYLKEESRLLYKLSTGETVDADEFKPVQDEYAEMGVTVIQERQRRVKVMYTRLFDADGWIEDEKRTIFRHWLNIVPMYGNFDIDDEGKLIYYGLVEKVMDPQRVLNYSFSREIEEGALAPRAKYWMTRKQAQGEEKTLQSLNTNTDPVQFYTPDDRVPGAPKQDGGAQVNPGLRTITTAATDAIRHIAGMFHANMGDNPHAQSGVAIENLQDAGDQGNGKYIKAREIAQAHTGRILVDAIPRVYQPGRQQRILNPDGSYEMETIGQPVFDNESMDWVYVYDLSEGTYDVKCSSGPGFRNRQSQTNSTLLEMGKVRPDVLELGADIVLKNTDAPGMDQVAARVRRRMVMQGLIPPDQLTEEEVTELQNTPQQESPEMVLARAEEGKAQSDLLDSQTKQMQIAGQLQAKFDELRLKEIELTIKAQETGANIEGIQARAVKDIAQARNIALNSGTVVPLIPQ